MKTISFDNIKKMKENAELSIDSLTKPYEIGQIVVTVAVCEENTQEIIEEFDTMAEAKKYVKENEFGKVDYWFLAAEIISKDGDVNIPVWAKNRREAVRLLKQIL